MIIFGENAQNIVFGILRHFHGHAQGVSDFSRTNHLCQIIKLIGLYQHAKFQRDSMTGFRKIGKKPHFWAFLTIFGHAEGVQDFFSKMRLRYPDSIRPTSHHAKFQKDPMTDF